MNADGIRRETVDVAIVGGGPAGLAAGTALARAGAGRVVVLEREVEPGGIRSTGLTSSLAIAAHIRDQLDAAGLALRERPEGLPPVRMPNIGETAPRPYAQPQRIARDPEYGRIVCFCERVTRGEIRDAAASLIPPVDLDGLRRRTRVLMGRCQGFFCGAHVAALLAEQTGADVGELREAPR